MVMIKQLFKRNKKRKYVSIEQKKEIDVPEGIMIKCDSCKKIMYSKEVIKNNHVCYNCDFHMMMTAHDRIKSVIDEGTFEELFEHITSVNPLNFPKYEEKINKDQKKTNLKEACITGVGEINGSKTAIGVMDAHFRMGSMGSAVGEKITRMIEHATANQLPFILFTASGGARMQEGILSLMQMAKTSVALKKHDEAGLLYIAYLTHPTTGGVSASFASVGDINISEPGALIGFAGRRIIEQTIGEDLPDDFQTAEFLLEHGMLDMVVHRKDMKKTLGQILELHTTNDQGGEMRC